MFGDGTVVFVHTPGHSYGLFSAIINGKDDYIILENGVAYLKESFSFHKIHGFIVDNNLAKNSLDCLIECKIILLIGVHF